MSNYVVAFRGGASGRFIANIMWMMINNLHHELDFTPENSAHEHNPWCVTWNSVIGADHNHKEVYSRWKFNVPDNGLFISHTYPDFTVINERIPNLRTVIITFSKNDLLEIATNMIYKNLVPVLKSFAIYNDKDELYEKVYKKEYEMYYLAYVKMYGKPMIVNDELFINREFMDTMVYLKYDTMLETCLTHEFFEGRQGPINENVLFIKFEDIFNTEDNSFVALKQLQKFLNIDNSTEAIEAVNRTYIKYVTNREEYLKHNLPIEKYEDYQIRKNTTLIPRYGWSAS